MLQTDNVAIEKTDIRNFTAKDIIQETAKDTKTVLIAEKRPLYMEKMLKGSGFNILKANTPSELISKAKTYRPDIIIGDFLYPEEKTSELCSNIRKNFDLENMPMIMVSSKRNITQNIKTVNGTVDDYIVRPFDNEELLARMGRVIKRTQKALNANPLTRLPGNLSIKEEINKRITEKETFASCYLDIDNFKAFNDYYGYERGDKAIELTAEILMDSINKVKQDSNTDKIFLGHIGGDDFVFITPVAHSDKLCSEIIKNFDSSIKELYNNKDLENDCIISKDRRGKIKKFPIMSVSIAVVSNKNRTIEHSAQVSQIASELKSYIKKFPNSNYMHDRRV